MLDPPRQALTVTTRMTSHAHALSFCLPRSHLVLVRSRFIKVGLKNEVVTSFRA